MDSLHNLPFDSSARWISYITCRPAAGRIATDYYLTHFNKYQITEMTLMNTKNQIILKQCHRSINLNNNSTFPIFSLFVGGIGTIE